MIRYCAAKESTEWSVPEDLSLDEVSNPRTPEGRHNLLRLQTRLSQQVQGILEAEPSEVVSVEHPARIAGQRPVRITRHSPGPHSTFGILITTVAPGLSSSTARANAVHGSTKCSSMSATMRQSQYGASDGLPRLRKASTLS